MLSLLSVKDSGKFGGKYVATKSFKDKKVISSGMNPSEVCEEAKKKGAEDPIVFYVPQEGMVQIY